MGKKVTISDEELEQLCKAFFQKHDIDGGGTISTKELVKVLRELGLHPESGGIEGEKAFAKQLMGKTDKDKSGSFSYQEFQKFFSSAYMHCLELGVLALDQAQKVAMLGASSDMPHHHHVKGGKFKGKKVKPPKFTSGQLNEDKPYLGEKDLVAEYEEFEADVQAAFAKYDKDNDGFISPEEIVDYISDMHLLDGALTKQELGNFVVNLFKNMDTNRDGQLSVKEFREMHNMAIRMRDIFNNANSATKSEILTKLFNKYANWIDAEKGFAKPPHDNSDSLEWHQFQEFFKVVKLVANKKFKEKDIEKLFGKVRAAREGSDSFAVDFQELLLALAMLAERLSMSYVDLVAHIEATATADNLL